MKHLYDNIYRFIGICVYFVFACAAMLFIDMPDANSSPPDKEICVFLERFHGHTCAGSLMGLRLGLAGKEALKEHGKLKAKTFVHSCQVDGIQVATGATYGNKTFTFEDRNERYLILTDVKSGKQVEARLTQEAMDNGKQFRTFSSEARSCAAGSAKQLVLQKKIDAILDWFRTAPDAEVVTVRSLK